MTKKFSGKELYDTCDDEVLEIYCNRIQRWDDPPRVRMAPLTVPVPALPALNRPSTPDDLYPLFALHVRPMDRISVWVEDILNTLEDYPYTMLIQPRVGSDYNTFGPVPRLIRPPLNWVHPVGALLFQWTLITGTQFEVWGACIDGAGLTVGTNGQEVTFGVIISDSGGACCDGDEDGGFVKGDWDITP